MFGLRRALFKRMGWRAHLSSLQIGGGVAERRPHVHAWLSETAKQMMTPRLTRTHQAEIATDRMSNKRASGSSVPRTNQRGLSAAQRRLGKSANAKASYEKYVTLARAAARSGDAIETENYYQHAEHYFRLMKDEPIGSGHEEVDTQRDERGIEAS